MPLICIYIFFFLFILTQHFLSLGGFADIDVARVVGFGSRWAEGCSWWSLWGCGGLSSWVAGCGGFALAVAMRKWWLISRQICGFLIGLSSDLWWLVEDIMGFCEIHVVGFVGFVMAIGGCGGLMNLWWVLLGLWWLVEDMMGLW